MGPVYTTTVDLAVKNSEVVIASISAAKTSITAVSFLSGPVGPAGPHGPQGSAGPQGVKGDQGDQGPAGVGIASGGNTSQMLTKNSNANYDTSWHTLGKSDVGLSSVDNTADVDKPVSTATLAALTGKVDTTDTRLTDARTPLDASVTDAKVAVGAAIAIAKLELDPTLRSNHSGTQTADTIINGTTNKVYTATEKTKLTGIATGATVNDTDANLKSRANHTGSQTASTISDFSAAADARITLQKGAASGLATLDGTGKVPSGQLPGVQAPVVERANYATMIATAGDPSTIYITTDDSKQYRWGGSAYYVLSPTPGSSDAVPEGSSNLYFTTSRATAAAPIQSVAGRTGVISLTKSDVGLSNLDNTSDLNKPVSTATQTALDATKNQLIGMIIALG